MIHTYIDEIASYTIYRYDTPVGIRYIERFVLVVGMTYVNSFNYWRMRMIERVI